MSAYPNFEAIVAERGVDQVAELSGVAPDVIELLARRTCPVAASKTTSEKIAVALGMDPDELFHPYWWDGKHLHDLQPLIDEAPSRCVTDPETLRRIDSQL